MTVVDFFPADIISCVEFNEDGGLLATGDKGGRVVIFQRDSAVSSQSFVCTVTFSLGKQFTITIELQLKNYTHIKNQG